ncbi:MAG: acyltransferase domain-containing protein [bacterium]|nr:acyltransferase domain-containing protein [bacterium]
MSESVENSNVTGMEVAVIGMAGRFPGARTISEFWENLKNGRECIAFFSRQELEEAGADAGLLKRPNYVGAKGVMPDADCFDALFFGYTPGEAAVMDPQVRVFHECAWEALGNAGYEPGTYNGRVGVYAGASSNARWEALMILSAESSGADSFSASLLSNKDFLGTHIAYKLNLKGPAFTLNTACSTSLVAIHTAVQSLLNGECEIALAGGVSVTLPLNRGHVYLEGMVLSPDGHCRAFDDGARGTVNGNGAGIVVLKLLESAIADRDYIHAVVKGSAVNNDGDCKVGFTAPGIEGQCEAVSAALYTAETAPESIGYVETHGTGTALGDPVEMEALKLAFAAVNNKKNCAVGSVKTNIGHLDAAAGVAAFIKTVLVLKHRQIPPSLHFETPNPQIDFENNPFYVNTGLREWKPAGGPLRAGVSAFGVGGTNAHVVLEEWVQGVERENAGEPQLLLLSALTKNALDRVTVNLVSHFKKNPHTPLADAAYTLQVGRKIFKHRKMLVCRGPGDAAAALSVPGDERVRTFSVSPEKPSVIFMFPGQGAQYAGMGKELYETEPVFRESMDLCFEILGCTAGSVGAAGIMEADIAQPVVFAFEYALATLLISWGIRPGGMIGHSLGEYAAACLSGVLGLEDTLKLLTLRGKLLRTLPAGAMLSVPLSEEALQALPVPVPGGGLSLAAVNGPSQCVVSGPPGAVEAFEKEMESNGYECRRIHVSHAAHSAMLDPVLKEFENAVEQVSLKEPRLPYISNVTGEWVTGSEVIQPAYWVRHLRQTVRFSAGIDNILLQEERPVFIEVGPGRTLTTLTRQHISPGKKGVPLTVNLVRHPREEVSDRDHLLNKIGQLWLYGITPDWSEFHRGEKRRRVPLPGYPFEPRRYPIVGDIFTRALAGRAVFPVSREAAGEPVKTETGILSALSRRQELDLSVEYGAPQDPVQQELTRVWEGFFGIEPLGIHDDFFELGGDSLKATALIAKINKIPGVTVPLGELFNNPTITGISRFISEAGTTTAGFAGLAGSLEKAEKMEFYPLSSSQERLYLLHQMQPHSPAYNMPERLELHREIDEKLVENVLEMLVERHQGLRTGIKTVNAVPVQFVAETCALPFRFEDISIMEEAGKQRKREDIYNRLALTPFDLETYPLFRAVLVKSAPRQYQLMFNFHHIISDGWSMDVLAKEFIQLYEGITAGEAVELAPLPLQYTDFACWQRGQLNSASPSADFWKKKLAGGVTTLHLPADFPAAGDTPGGAGYRCAVNNELKEALRKLAARRHTSLFTVMFSIYILLLSRVSGQEYVGCSVIAAGREHEDLQGIAGLFVNSLLFNADVDEDQPFEDFLGTMDADVRKSLQYQGYPMEPVFEELGMRYPRISVSFNMLNFPGAAENRRMESLAPCPIDGVQDVKFDLELYLIEYENGTELRWVYRESLFKPATIKYIADLYLELAAFFSRDPRGSLAAYKTGPVKAKPGRFKRKGKE